VDTKATRQILRRKDLYWYGMEKTGRADSSIRFPDRSNTTILGWLRYYHSVTHMANNFTALPAHCI